MTVPPHTSRDWADRFFDDGFEATSALLGKYDTTERDLDDLLALLRPEPGARVLDVPCGFGRHSAHLARLGFRVTGVDNSPAQLERARRHCPSTTTLVLADMRQPPPGPFDLVLNLWSSFGFLDTPDDDLAALTAWHDALAPGGRLVMELTTLERAEHENRRANEPISTRHAIHGAVTEDARYDWTTGLAHIRYTRPGWSRTLRIRMYSRPRLRTLLETAGFTDIHVMGTFQGDPPTPTNRTIITATPSTNPTR